MTPALIASINTIFLCMFSGAISRLTFCVCHIKAFGNC
jgi:hypothetical protein